MRRDGVTMSLKTRSMPLIYKIQQFSIHDGPGIRSTVFFKGCPLRCKWCHNPESWSFESGADQIGQEWQIPALVRELEKDRIFYEQSDGGVTLSGGEPLAQDIEYISALLRELARKGISTVIDTCGDVPYENFEAVLHYTDFFLYDLKLWDNKRHIALTEVPNERILLNLSRLGRSGAKICLRFPLIAGVNDSLADMEKIAAWLDKEGVRPVFVSLLPYHEYGNNKYARLELAPPPSFSPPSQGCLSEIKAFWENRNCKTAIGGTITL